MPGRLMLGGGVGGAGAPEAGVDTFVIPGALGTAVGAVVPADTVSAVPPGFSCRTASRTR